jgi:cytochrome c553
MSRDRALADVAAYFAGQQKRNPLPSTLASPAPNIQQLIELGDPARALPPCAACHRDGSGGPIETPVLYEQRYEYIVARLRNYASGARRNDVYARMRTIAAKLSPEEIDGVARYYASGLR